MKKRFVFLAVTALLSVGLAFYANRQNTTQILLESDVEALTSSGDPGGGSTYMEFGSSPNRVWADTEAHTLTIEGKQNMTDDNDNPINGCENNTNATCTIRTSTPVYDTCQIISHVTEFLKALAPLILKLIGLMV